MSSSVETTFSEWNDDELFVSLRMLLNTDLFFAAKAAVRVFFAARKELDFAAKERGKVPKTVVLVVEKEQEEEQEEEDENPTVPRSIKRSPRSARKEDVERGIMIRCLLSLRGELEVTFCVTLFHVVDKDDVFSGDPHKRGGWERLLPAKEHETEGSSRRNEWCDPARKADEDDTDPVQETFKKLYKPNAGKRIKYGVFQETLSESDKNTYTDEEKTRLRAKAAEELTVIDDEERKRRGWFWFWFSPRVLFFKSVS